MSGMTDSPVRDPVLAVSIPASATQKRPKNIWDVLRFYVLSELPMPMTGSIETDRHMGVTHNDGVQQYVAHPSRKHSRIRQEAL